MPAFQIPGPLDNVLNCGDHRGAHSLLSLSNSKDTPHDHVPVIQPSYVHGTVLPG